MLVTSFAASVGGMATPVGTPPNLIGMGLIERVGGRKVTSSNGPALGLPAGPDPVRRRGRVRLDLRAAACSCRAAGRAAVAAELKRLGPLSRGERNVLIAFGVTVLLWVAPGLFAIAGQGELAFACGLQASVPESVAAMLGATLLFLLPVRLDQAPVHADVGSGGAHRVGHRAALWRRAGARRSGVHDRSGEGARRGLTSWTPGPTTFALTVLFTGVAIVLSETTSNTASANMIVPVAIAVAQGVRRRPAARRRWPPRSAPAWAS